MKASELLQLLMDRHGDNPNSLAQKSKVPQSTIFRFLNGTAKEPRLSTLEKLSNVYMVPVEIFLSDSARAKFLKDLKEMGDSSPNTVQVFRGERVPLISWVQAGHWCEAMEPFEPGDAEDWLFCPANHSSSTFALRVRGVSMEPKYRDGAIIYIDPERGADHLSNVIVRMEDEAEVTFKQLVIEGEKRFLRPLNPDWPGPKLISIDGDAVICGVVIGQFIED